MNNSYSEHSKLAEAKQMRKRADEDARLLANRIALLRQEEQKAHRKIEETRQKAQKILSLRNKNTELLKLKEEDRRLKQEKEFQRLAEQRKVRELKLFKSQQKLSNRQNRALSEANALKESRKRNLEQIEYNRKDDLVQRAALRNFIKNQQREAEEKKRKMERDRMERIRIETMKKVEDENRARRAREEEIARMEQEELELIQKLQNTQMMQKNAYEELENALAGPLGANPAF